MAGYSGTPLVKKLGIREAMRVVVLNRPAGYEELLGALPDRASIASQARDGTAFVHLFVKSAADLGATLKRLRTTIASDGVIWVSWPKRSSKVTTDVTEDVIRAIALPMGFVDIKVCAVNDVWSGLKLVIRKSER